MESKNNSNSEQNNLNAPDIPKIRYVFLKYPSCYKIPEISATYRNNYNYKCKNNHTEDLELNELLNKCTTYKELYK